MTSEQRKETISNLVSTIEKELSMIIEKDSTDTNAFRKVIDGNFILKTYADYYEYLLDFKSKLSEELKTGNTSFVNLPKFHDVVANYLTAQEKLPLTLTNSLNNAEINSTLSASSNENDENLANSLFGGPDSSEFSASTFDDGEPHQILKQEKVKSKTPLVVFGVGLLIEVVFLSEWIIPSIIVVAWIDSLTGKNLRISFLEFAKKCIKKANIKTEKIEELQNKLNEDISNEEGKKR